MAIEGTNLDLFCLAFLILVECAVIDSTAFYVGALDPTWLHVNDGKHIGLALGHPARLDPNRLC